MVSIDRWQRVEERECRSAAERAGFRAWAPLGPKLNPYRPGPEADQWERGWERAEDLAEYERSIGRP